MTSRVATLDSSEPVETEHRVGRVLVTSMVVPGGWDVPPHGHEDAGVCVIVSGGFDERTRRGEHACLAGTLRYSPPDDYHRIRLRDATMECLVIELDRDELPSSAGPVFLHSPPLADIAARLIDEVADDSTCCPLVAESMALQLFAGIVRHEKDRRYRHPPRWLLEIRRTLDDPTGWSLSLDELGALSGHNGAHLAFAFREHFGLTIGDYVRARQLSVARRELLHSRIPISRVAAAAGFADQSHLTRVMRRALGTTPGQLRAAAQARVA
jgi:AraC family transcriptional regulator